MNAQCLIFDSRESFAAAGRSTWTHAPQMLGVFLAFALVVTGIHCTLAEDGYCCGRQVSTPVASRPSVGELRLNQLFYENGDQLQAEFFVTGPDVVRTDHMKLTVVGAKSHDVEYLQLVPTGDDRRFVTKPLSVEVGEADGNPQKFDGRLSLAPNELLFAMYGVNLKTKSDHTYGAITDFAIADDPAFDDAPAAVDARLSKLNLDAHTARGKPVGALAVQGVPPVQFAVNEIMIRPRSAEQLKRFLKETGGRVTRRMSADDENGWCLVRLKPHITVPHQLRQLRALRGSKRPLFASSKKTLDLYASVVTYQLQGYQVAINPRLQWMAEPSTREMFHADSSQSVNSMRGTPSQVTGAMSNRNHFRVPNAWAYLALWDRDHKRIRTAFIDQGFAPNEEFRGFPDDIHQMNIADGSRGEGAAVSPPSVGASFFGERVWHGNMVVAIAGGRLNNGRGVAGSGGQVVEPMLYRMDLHAYAFELGQAIRQATEDGAQVINVSAGYPNRLPTELGITYDLGEPEGRFAFCLTLSLGFHSSLPIVCETLGLGPACHSGVSISLFGLFDTACLFFTAEDRFFRGPMEEGVRFAHDHGVPVIASAGNAPEAGVLCEFFDCNNHDINAWRIIPASLPNVICVGAAANDAPFENTEFFGDRVDIWAPNRFSFLHPQAIDAVGDPNDQVLEIRNSATSGAAAFVTGVVAMMQAANPELNRSTVGLTDEQRRHIPLRIRRLLRSSAATPMNDAALTTSTVHERRRRGLVDAFAAVRDAAEVARTLHDDSAPAIPALRVITAGGGTPYFDDSLGFNETNFLESHDIQGTAHRVNFENAESFTDTILRIPEIEPFGRLFTDEDHFAIDTPSNPGVYRGGSFILSVPQQDVWGDVRITRFDGAREGTLVETWMVGDTRIEEIEFELPPLWDNRAADYRVDSSGDSVYRIRYSPGHREDYPEPDRFDELSRNDTPAAATILGQATENWIAGEAIAGEASVRVVPVGELNFDEPTDVDHFLVFPPTSWTGDCECGPQLAIQLNGMGAHMTITGSDGQPLERSTPPAWTISCEQFRGRFPLRITIENATRGPVNYRLDLRWSQPDPRLCRALERIYPNLPRDAQSLLDLIQPGPQPWPTNGFTDPSPIKLVRWFGGNFELDAVYDDAVDLRMELYDLRTHRLGQSTRRSLPTKQNAQSTKGTASDSAVYRSKSELKVKQLRPGCYFVVFRPTQERIWATISVPRTAYSAPVYERRQGQSQRPLPSPPSRPLAPPKQVRFEGYVLTRSAQGFAKVPAARIVFANQTTKRAAFAKAGHFVAELPLGKYRVVVDSAGGFQSRIRTVYVEHGMTAPRFLLAPIRNAGPQPEPPKARPKDPPVVRVVGAVTIPHDDHRLVGVPGATLSFANKQMTQRTKTGKRPPGGFVLALPAGTYDVTVSVPGMGTLHRKVTVQPGMKALRLFLAPQDATSDRPIKRARSNPDGHRVVMASNGHDGCVYLVPLVGRPEFWRNLAGLLPRRQLFQRH